MRSWTFGGKGGRAEGSVDARAAAAYESIAMPWLVLTVSPKAAEGAEAADVAGRCTGLSFEPRALPRAWAGKIFEGLFGASTRASTGVTPNASSIAFVNMVLFPAPAEGGDKASESGWGLCNGDHALVGDTSLDSVPSLAHVNVVVTPE